MIKTNMKLTPEEIDILNGSQGETMRKTMETLVRYGDAYHAECLVPLDGAIHVVCSFGMPTLRPFFKIMEQYVAEGIKTKLPFTADPRPMDYENVEATEKEKQVFNMIYADQEKYEETLRKVGLKDKNAFSCACYFDEVGNIPKRGDILAWAESSAVVYANSVIGARTNRTSGVMELFSGIVGKTPKFGFLTDEGRKADWIVEVKTAKKPRPQVLGSAIGMKVLEQVPYIRGLDRWIGTELTSDAKDFLKDMGAATASNGAVGLYHVEHLTPEAKDFGESLIRPNAKTYIIDDAELERVVASYPIMWKNVDDSPEIAFVGCPHCSFVQLCEWTQTLEQALKEAGKEKVIIPTIFTTAPDVIAEFKKSEFYPRLMATGAHLTYICPLMYMSNPLCSAKRVITNSNKLRTYSVARYVDDAELIHAVVKGGLH
ncbi:hypothetical protein Psch_01489 [Pelotomaculum schinkii]|uniref:Phosphomevalonate dehydratase large subunit-like domain-containing protein n=1 Tax=Pelotomaculum schinkii TaxID=78350 RepID=A0A4Y7RG15_9FIRM|nr:aconitase X [Pelotomaculum schinkii]TEB07934.1 hypothetical protein Psch_01489 [Pelotomaculum schinkii]